MELCPNINKIDSPASPPAPSYKAHWRQREGLKEETSAAAGETCMQFSEKTIAFHSMVFMFSVGEVLIG